MEGTITPGTSWNQNCGGLQAPGNGHYNGQDKTFTLAGGSGTVQVGNPGNDNFDTNLSFYIIEAPDGFSCVATFSYETCAVPTLMSTPQLNPQAPPGALPVPYCPGACGGAGDAADGELVLESVFCCPI